MPAVLPISPVIPQGGLQQTAVKTDPRFVANPQGLGSQALAAERAPLYANGGVPMIDNQGNAINSVTGTKSRLKGPGGTPVAPGQASPYGLAPGTTLGTPFTPSYGRRHGPSSSGGMPQMPSVPPSAPMSGIAPYGGGSDYNVGGGSAAPKNVFDTQPQPGSLVDPQKDTNAGGALNPSSINMANMSARGRTLPGVSWQINDRPDGEQEAVHDPASGAWMTTPTPNAVITNHNEEQAPVALVKDLKQKGVPVKTMPQGSSADLSPVPGMQHHGSPITIHIHAGITQSKGKPRGSSANKRPVPGRAAIAPPQGMPQMQGVPQSPVSPPPLPQAPAAAQALPQQPQPGMPMPPMGQPGMPQQPGMPPVGIAPPPTIIPPGTPMPKGYAQPPTLQQVPTDRGHGSISQHNGITETPDASPGGASRDKRPVPGIRETPGKMPKGSSADAGPAAGTKTPFTPVAKTHGNKFGGNFPTAHRDLAGPSTNVISKTGTPVIPPAIARAQAYNSAQLPGQAAYNSEQINLMKANHEIDNNGTVINPNSPYYKQHYDFGLKRSYGDVDAPTRAGYQAIENGQPPPPGWKPVGSPLGSFGRGSVLSGAGSGIGAPAPRRPEEIAAQWRPGAQPIMQALGNAAAADADAHSYRPPGAGAVKETAPGVREIMGGKYGNGIAAQPGAIDAALSPATAPAMATSPVATSTPAATNNPKNNPFTSASVPSAGIAPPVNTTNPTPPVNDSHPGMHIQRVGGKSVYVPNEGPVEGAVNSVVKGVTNSFLPSSDSRLPSEKAYDALKDRGDLTEDQKAAEVEKAEKNPDWTPPHAAPKTAATTGMSPPQIPTSSIAPPASPQNTPPALVPAPSGSGIAPPPSYGTGVNGEKVNTSDPVFQQKLAALNTDPRFQGMNERAAGVAELPALSSQYGDALNRAGDANKAILNNATNVAAMEQQVPAMEQRQKQDVQNTAKAQRDVDNTDQQLNDLYGKKAAVEKTLGVNQDAGWHSKSIGEIGDDVKDFFGFGNKPQQQQTASDDQPSTPTAARGRTLPGKMKPQSDTGIAPHAASLEMMSRLAPLLVGAHRMLEQHARGGMKESFLGGILPGAKRTWDGGMVPDLAPGMVGDYRAKDFTGAMASDKKPEFKMAFLGGSLPGRGYDGGSIGDMPKGMVNDYDGKDFTGALESGIHKAARGRRMPGKKIAMPMPSAGIAPPPTMPPMQPPSQDQGGLPPVVPAQAPPMAARGRTMTGIADPQNTTSINEPGLASGKGELAFRPKTGQMQVLARPGIVKNPHPDAVHILPTNMKGVVVPIGSKVR